MAWQWNSSTQWWQASTYTADSWTDRTRSRPLAIGQRRSRRGDLFRLPSRRSWRDSGSLQPATGQGSWLGRRRSRPEHGERPQYLADSPGIRRQGRDDWHRADPALAPGRVGCHLRIRSLGRVGRSTQAGRKARWTSQPLTRWLRDVGDGGALRRPTEHPLGHVHRQVHAAVAHWCTEAVVPIRTV